jgi:hypothetical protein
MKSYDPRQEAVGLLELDRRRDEAIRVLEPDPRFESNLNLADDPGLLPGPRDEREEQEWLLREILAEWEEEQRDALEFLTNGILVSSIEEASRVDRHEPLWCRFGF